MVDIFLEVAGSIFAAIIFFIVLRGLRHPNVKEQSGTRLVIAGFGLLFFSLLIDITDNFPGLNYLVLVGDTESQAFLEKVVGMLIGLLLLSLGLWRWIPSIMALEDTRKSLSLLNLELDQRVKERTIELESANRQLTCEIDERSKVETRLKYQATHDSLTGLPNRHAVNEFLKKQVSRLRKQGSYSAIMFLDLDDFKKVNDHLGHEVGDHLLLEVARRLVDTVPSDAVLGRFGGDEFIVILPDINNPDEACTVAEALLGEFRRFFVLADRDFLLTASVGIAIYPGDGETPQELLCHADTAMYRAKKDGRDTYRYFTNDMNRDLSRRLALEEQMHGALERNEFSLRYQPVIDLEKQCVTGAEALLRWHNPVLGDVTPDEFIPIAEDTGLIISLGQFVLSTAFSNSIVWRKRCNGDFKIAINISPLQFREGKLVRFIEESLLQADLPASALELEITEGVLMDACSVIDDSLKTLQKMGVGLSMDDFGTGYSSLSYLRRYPFDTLKIDRSFIEEVAINKGDRELVIATISMAQALGLQVVAEGVETDEQLTFIKEQGCALIQGYYFSRPLLADDFDQYLDNWVEAPKPWPLPSKCSSSLNRPNAVIS